MSKTMGTNMERFEMDALVVGCGLTGAVAARRLAERGTRVVIWERRPHIGGNLYDYVDEHGILVQKYGPHTFHTMDPPLFDYMRRFAAWKPFKLTCGAVIRGKFTPTPFNFQTIDDFYPPAQAEDLKKRIRGEFGDRQTATVIEALNSLDPMVRAYAEFLFQSDYSLYTAKQWGVPPSEIDVSVLKRVPLRFSYENGYFDDPIQVMPAVSFVHFFENLIRHPNIQVRLGVEALDHLKAEPEQGRLTLDGAAVSFPVVYTGALDELFECRYGDLPYRSLRFDWKFEEVDSLQDAPVVAYPEAEGYTRITEYKKLPPQQCRGTSYAVEYPLPYRPQERAEPYYPVLTGQSRDRYARYRALAARISNLYPCGRLADFQYYNMDQALKKALELELD